MIWSIVWVVVYFIPVALAYDRRHPSRHAIAALTILLGWTVLGWVIAFIWALTGESRRVN